MLLLIAFATQISHHSQAASLWQILLVMLGLGLGIPTAAFLFVETL
jgi:hypothetical protein